MDSRFADKDAKIIVVSGLMNYRSMISNELKSFGFQDISGTSNITDALDLMETEAKDWLFVPLALDDQVNVFNLLDLCKKVPELQKVKVSVMLKDEEHPFIQKLFENGALSWQSSATTREVVKQGIEDLMKHLERNKWNPDITSAEYIRASLKESQSYDVLLNLEKSLNEIFPGEPRLLFYLGCAQLLAGQKDRAKKTLSQAWMLEEKLGLEITEIAKKHNLSLSEPDQSVLETMNILDIESCVVVEPEPKTLETMKKILQNFGIPQIKAFGHPHAAWNWLKENPEPQLIIHEWSQPAMPGSVFLQRIRSLGFHGVPIIITSSILKLEDLPLIRELGVSNTFTKPLDEAEFTKTIIWTIQQDRLPTEPKSIETKIYQNLQSKNIRPAQMLKNVLFADANVHAAHKKLVEAEFCYFEGQFNRCKNLVIQAMKEDRVTLRSMNLLGKSLMHLQNFEAALQCFENAQDLSPLNLNRLCEIAKVQLELGHFENIDATLAEAKTIDKESPVVAETEAEIAIVKGSPEAAKKIMTDMASLANIMAYLNNRGVALTRCQRVDEGISMYEQALEAIPESRMAESAIVYYNLGLANIRLKNYEEAAKILAKGAKLSKDKVRAKIQSISKRLEAAMKAEEDLILRTRTMEEVKTELEETGDTPLEGDESFLAIAKSFAIRLGTACCYNIFKAELAPESYENINREVPKFTLRRSIARSDYAS